MRKQHSVTVVLTDRTVTNHKFDDIEKVRAFVVIGTSTPERVKSIDVSLKDWSHYKWTPRTGWVTYSKSQLNQKF